ncbi:tetratricopeptide repeat protein [Halioglobus maricola]|uniref:Tetratricopeptide repeat protein n=1 Tax=Halioglobus maricola TaxID=2601894 RepID=A0A5P9NPC8_9GAMM|nr:tetratricopeptide repeat protein [Halioglobus maricola]QFU77661.1 tetratricopeptide repeat protein [Halioglobus maricola]
MSPGRRALLLGWSGADWELLHPLIAAGAMPNLAKFLENSVQGSLRTLQPQFPPLLWTSVVTGKGPVEHNILHGLTVHPTGDILPVSRLDIGCQTITDIVNAAGGTTVSINWPLSYPAVGHSASELCFRLAGSSNALEPLAPAAVSPSHTEELVQGLRMSPAELSREELEFFVSDLDNAQAAGDPLLQQLAVALAETISTHVVAMEMMESADWNLALLRYELLDTLGPAFMANHPPQLGWVNDELYDRYQGTIAAGCRYLDLLFAALLDRAGNECSIVLFSERGLQSGEQRPNSRELAEQRGAAPWYREQGILAMSGPQLHHEGSVHGAGLLDIAPTVLAMLDLPRGDDMRGRVLAESFSEPPPDIRIGTHEPLTPAKSETLSPAQTDALRSRWLETGVIKEADVALTSAGILSETSFNRAIAMMENRQFQSAHKILEKLHQEQPENERIALHLARCKRRTGHLEDSAKLLQAVVDHPQQRPYELIQLAQLQIATGLYEQALGNLFRAEQAEGERPQVHATIGQVYLKLGRWEQAERAYRKALQRDPQHAEAHRGMAATRLGQRDFLACIDSALTAIDLDRNQPQAHYFLARALAATERPDTAIAAYETTLELNPDHTDARQQLLILLEQQGFTEEAERHRAKLIRQEALAAVSKQMHAQK